MTIVKYPDDTPNLLSHIRHESSLEMWIHVISHIDINGQVPICNEKKILSRIPETKILVKRKSCVSLDGP